LDKRISSVYIFSINGKFALMNQEKLSFETLHVSIPIILINRIGKITFLRNHSFH